MVFIPRWERYRDKKPSGAVEIDWGNELTDGIIVCCYEGNVDSGLVNVVDNKLFTKNGQNLRKVNRFDYDGFSTQTSVQYNYFKSAPGDYSVTNEVFMFAAVDFGNLAAYGPAQEIIFIKKGDSSGVGMYSLGFIPYTSKFRPLINTDVVNGWTTNVDTYVPVKNSTLHTFSSSYKSGVGHVGFFDGEYVSTYPAEGNIKQLQAASTCDLVGGEYATSRSTIGGQYYSILSSKYKTHEEQQAFHEAPYQILKPRRKWFVFSGVSANIFNQSISLATNNSLIESVNIDYNQSAILSSAYNIQTDKVVSANLSISLDSLQQLSHDSSANIDGTLALTTKSGTTTVSQVFTTIDTFIDIANSYGVNHSVSIDYNPTISINYTNSVSSSSNLFTDQNISLNSKVNILSTTKNIFNDEIALHVKQLFNENTISNYNPLIEISTTNDINNISNCDYNTNIALAISNIFSSNAVKDLVANILLIAQQGISTTQLITLEGSIDLGIINTYSNETLTTINVNVDLTSAFLESLGTSVISQLDVSLDASYEVLTNGRNPNLVIRTNKGQEILVKAVNKDLKIQYIDRNIYI